MGGTICFYILVSRFCICQLINRQDRKGIKLTSSDGELPFGMGFVDPSNCIQLDWTIWKQQRSLSKADRIGIILTSSDRKLPFGVSFVDPSHCIQLVWTPWKQQGRLGAATDKGQPYESMDRIGIKLTSNDGNCHLEWALQIHQTAFSWLGELGRSREASRWLEASTNKEQP